jgi:predicted nucleic acid-binding protein
MIVVDNSVWIGLLRDAPRRPVQVLRSVVGREPLLLGDLVLAEVLAGARDEVHAAALERSCAVSPWSRC